MKLTSRLLIFFYLMTQLGCQNPTKMIDQKITEFEKNYPNNFVTYQVADRKMHFAFSGDVKRRPLVFVHGSPGSWKGWSEFLLDSELQKKFHVIAIDRPGFAGSDRGVVERSMATQAKLIIEALKYNQSGLPAILVGHSLGGPVIARMAMDYPDQVAGLVFVASSVDPSLEEMKWFQWPANWSLFRWMIPTELLVCNDEIRPLKSELEKMQPLWSRIKAQVYIIQGEDDDLVPPANVDYLEKKYQKN